MKINQNGYIEIKPIVVYLSKVFWYIARIVIRKLSIPTTTVSISDILS